MPGFRSPAAVKKVRCRGRFGRPRTCTMAMNEFERKDDLGLGGLHIWQDRREFCFGIDAVLLSAFAEIKRGEHVLDLCSGNGIIPILLAGKTEAAHITGIEINPVQTALFRRSIEENHLAHISVLEGDIKDAARLTADARFDVVTCNPPYIKAGQIQNPSESRAIARHEILCTLEEVLKVAALRLRFGGRFYMVHRPDRLTDILSVMRKCSIEPKRLRMVHANESQQAGLVLLEGTRGGGAFLRVMPPLILYNADGTYTEEALKQYGRDTK